MKNIILASLVLATAVFARTETIELTGEYSEQLGNPFKKVLNINKTNNISIYSENKDVVLKVESNLSKDIFLIAKHQEKVVLKNKEVENIVEDFYIEEFNVSHSKSKKDAVVIDVISGVVSLSYFNNEYTNQIPLLSGIEVTLIASIDGVKKEIKMDHTLGKAGEDYDLVISSKIEIDLSSLNERLQEIIETEIYVLVKEKDKK